MGVSGKGVVAGIMGWPVAHSRSPRLHGFWLDLHGVDGAYVPLAVHPEHLAEALAALPKLGFRGVNVTVPHKKAVLGACDDVTSLARKAGAANTLVVTPNGGLSGSNTDGYGFLESIRQQVGACPTGPVLVLGAGGAARSIILVLKEIGTFEILVANRTWERAVELATWFGDGVEALRWSQIPDGLARAELVVNTTSLGLKGNPPLELDLGPLDRRALVADIVYVPLRTAFLATAEARGNPTVDGLGMLIHQARPGFQAWFGIEISDDAVAAARRLLEDDLRVEQGLAA